MSSWFRSTPKTEELLEEERLIVAATEAIAEAMEKRGVNKRQLADVLDVRPSEISQRLSGRRNLTLRSLAAMLHALGARVRLSIEESEVPFTAGVQWISRDTGAQQVGVASIPHVAISIMNVGQLRPGDGRAMDDPRLVYRQLSSGVSAFERLGISPGGALTGSSTSSWRNEIVSVNPEQSAIDVSPSP